MNYIQIKKNCKGYNIDCLGTPKGMPIPPSTCVRFSHGIPGFEQVRQWRFTANVDVHPFLHMSADDESVRFVCIEAFRICPGYRLYLPFSSSTPLAITAQSRIAVLSIVTVGDKPEDTTANLMSPIVVNVDARQGEQAIAESSPYPLKYRIWDSLQLSETETEEEPQDELLAAMG